MNILTSKQVRVVDAYTIKHESIPSIDLMERAAMACTNWIIEHKGSYKLISVFVGPGNNGGDGLAITRQLADKGFKMKVYLIHITSHLSQDAAVNFKRLQKQGKVEIVNIKENDPLPEINPKSLVLDALFGSGLSRPLGGLAADVVKHINQSGAEIIAVDIPSGLFGEDNESNTGEIVKASHTLAFQLPKLSFFFAENEIYTGRWHVLPIGLDKDFIEKQDAKYKCITKKNIKDFIHKRKKFVHKGHFGHALLLSGSYGKMGAAILGARACLRTGVGLLTTHVPQCGYAIIQTAVPEAMTFIDPAAEMFSQVPEMDGCTAIGIGPGIGTNPVSQQALKSMLEKVNIPLVLDADAINILAQNKKWMELLPENTVLTPHPGEFDRIAGTSKNAWERHVKQMTMAQKYRLYIILKGAYTSVATPDGMCYFNTTGNPGMATAGSGDVLTGMVLSLLAQYYTSFQASVLGVYLHGLAGDIAAECISEEAVTANDIVENIGNAFKKIKE